MQNLKPMDAVSALYSREDRKLSAGILASLSKAIFEGCDIEPANPIKRALARISYRVLALTTKVREGTDVHGNRRTMYSNSILERCGHAYARALMTSSSGDVEALVEGGDPMNGPYMMISPEIRGSSGVWDKLFLDSVQSRDVQVRIIWETRATYKAAKQRLDRGQNVKLKAVAAGTGLSMLLVYDRLVRDGYDPARFSALITDRDASNMTKTNCLIETLAATWETQPGRDWRKGITAHAEDLLASGEAVGTAEKFDVITAIGILEYFQGSTCTTTEQKFNLKETPDGATAHDVADRLAAMSEEGASLVVNTYREDASVRIMELFGKRFDYRRREDLQCLLKSVGFRPVHLEGSGNIYDVEVYEKTSTSGS